FANNILGKVLAWLQVNVAKAAPGNFNPTNTPTNFGVSVYAVRDQDQIHGVNFATQRVVQYNPTATPPVITQPPTPTGGGNPCTIEGLKANNNSISTLPQCINQIY